MKRAAITFCFLLVCLSTIGFADTQTVTNCADSGPGSLRQAMADASAGDEIVFEITLEAVGYSTGETSPGLVTEEAASDTWFRIITNSELIFQDSDVSIRGSTQTIEGNNSLGPTVEVRANGTYSVFSATASTDRVTIEGLVINRCGGS
ncbi:MAG: hypothetical protein KKA31_03915, partial [Candidatus Margulisbacteria bacterium]|nr:hypothetical protein [Candidatus Margulisiibacteriota bacterium]